MTGKKIIWMAIIFVILATIAVIQKQNSTLTKNNKETTLLAGIDLNTITSIEVKEKSDIASLIKKDGKWVISSLYNYPVDFNKLADAIQKSSQVKIGAPIRAGNVDTSEFGLDKTAKHIAVKSASKEIASLEIGASRNASRTVGWANQHFIRKTGNDSIYLVNYDFRPFSANSADWMKKNLLNVNSSDIVAVEIGNIKLKLIGSDWKLSDLTKKEETQSTEANKLRSVLQYFNCANIADPSLSDIELGFDTPIVYTAHTKDGFTYTVKIGKKIAKGRYTRFAVAYNKPIPPAEPGKNADDKTKEAYKKQLNTFNATTAENEKKAKELNNKLSPWTYIIDNYKADTFLIDRAKLVKNKELPKKKNKGKHSKAKSIT